MKDVCTTNVGVGFEAPLDKFSKPPKYESCSIKTKNNFEKKSIFSKLFDIYYRTFKVFTIKYYRFHPVPSLFIKYMKSVSCQTFEGSFCRP